MNLLLTACALMLIYCTSISDDVQRVEIRKVDFDITTFSKVMCDEFEKGFSGQVDTIIITDINELKKITSFIANLNPKLRSNYTPDVRAKVFVHYLSGRVDSLCMGNNVGFILNGKLVEIDKDMVDFVDKYSNKGH